MRTLAVVAALALAPSATLAEEGRPTVGVGISIVPRPLEGPAQSPTAEIYLPIRVAPNLRIEPSLGIRTVDRQTAPNNVDESDLTLGIGIFIVTRVAPPVDVYFGGRLKLNFASVKNDFTGASDSGTDVFVAAALGGEDFLFSRFSVGLEAQLGVYSLSSASQAGEKESGFYTTGLAFLRVYF